MSTRPEDAGTEAALREFTGKSEDARGGIRPFGDDQSFPMLGQTCKRTLPKVDVEVLQIESATPQFGDETAQVFPTHHKARAQIQQAHRATECAQHHEACIEAKPKKRKPRRRHRAKENDAFEKRSDPSAKTKRQCVVGKLPDRCRHRVFHEFANRTSDDAADQDRVKQEERKREKGQRGMYQVRSWNTEPPQQHGRDDSSSRDFDEVANREVDPKEDGKGFGGVKGFTEDSHVNILNDEECGDHSDNRDDEPADQRRAGQEAHRTLHPRGTTLVSFFEAYGAPTPQVGFVAVDEDGGEEHNQRPTCNERFGGKCGPAECGDRSTHDAPGTRTHGEVRIEAFALQRVEEVCCEGPKVQADQHGLSQVRRTKDNVENPGNVDVHEQCRSREGNRSRCEKAAEQEIVTNASDDRGIAETAEHGRDRGQHKREGQGAWTDAFEKECFASREPKRLSKREECRKLEEEKEAILFRSPNRGHQAPEHTRSLRDVVLRFRGAGVGLGSLRQQPQHTEQFQRCAFSLARNPITHPCRIGAAPARQRLRRQTVPAWCQ